MSRRSLIKIAVAAFAAGLAACSGSGSSTASGANAAATVSAVPTVTMMAGGIDSQIYLPYQFAQDLGFYKKYGINMVLAARYQLTTKDFNRVAVVGGRAGPRRLGRLPPGRRVEGGRRTGRADRGRDAALVRIQQADHEGRLHGRTGAGQGPVPPRRRMPADGP